MPQPIKIDSLQADWTTRIFHSEAVVASPAAAAETIIASVTVSADLRQEQGVQIEGWAAYTVGTNGTAVTFRVRRTDVNGTVKINSGALTRAAAALAADSVNGFDALGAVQGQVYVLTMQVTAGSATSTVSAVELACIVF